MCQSPGNCELSPPPPRRKKSYAFLECVVSTSVKLLLRWLTFSRRGSSSSGQGPARRHSRNWRQCWRQSLCWMHQTLRNHFSLPRMLVMWELVLYSYKRSPEAHQLLFQEAKHPSAQVFYHRKGVFGPGVSSSTLRSVSEQFLWSNCVYRSQSVNFPWAIQEQEPDALSLELDSSAIWTESESYKGKDNINTDALSRA